MVSLTKPPLDTAIEHLFSCLSFIIVGHAAGEVCNHFHLAEPVVCLISITGTD
jgi:hypothetical protein